MPWDPTPPRLPTKRDSRKVTFIVRSRCWRRDGVGWDCGYSYHGCSELIASQTNGCEFGKTISWLLRNLRLVGIRTQWPD